MSTEPKFDLTWPATNPCQLYLGTWVTSTAPSLIGRTQFFNHKFGTFTCGAMSFFNSTALYQTARSSVLMFGQTIKHTRLRNPHFFIHNSPASPLDPPGLRIVDSLEENKHATAQGLST